MARDETEGSVIRAIATCLHESGRIDASVDEITARLEAREDALWTAQIRPLLDKLEDRLTTPTAFQTTHDRLVARAREDWLAQTAERVWRETFVIVPAAVTQVLFHTTREYDDQTRGTYESYSGVELFDEDENLIDDDALPELLGLSNTDGEDAKEWLQGKLINSRFPSAADLGEMFIRGEDGETILLTRDRLHPPEAMVPVYTAADSFDESDPYAPPATYTDSSDRRWEVLLVSAPADATVQED